MTYEEIKELVQRLPITEQVRLVEFLNQAVRERLGQPDASVESADTRSQDDAWQEERARLLSGIPSDSPIHRTFGMLRTAAKAPTDDKIEEEYRNYLMRKYA
jgi:hypothetical protein